jgi:hypothetical protein
MGVLLLLLALGSPLKKYMNIGQLILFITVRTFLFFITFKPQKRPAHFDRLLLFSSVFRLVSENVGQSSYTLGRPG